MSTMRFATHGPDPAGRLAAIQQAWTAMLGMEFEARGAELPSFVLRGDSVNGVSLAAIGGSAACLRRTEEQACAAADDIVLCMARGANVMTEDARGRKVLFSEGGVHIWPANRRMQCEVDGRYSALLMSFPRTVFDRHGIDLDHIASERGLRRAAGELGLLEAYALSFLSGGAAMTPSTRRLGARHMTDLALALLRPEHHRRDGLPSSAVRAARLAAIKADIAARLTDPGLSAQATARRHRISARYMRSLFEDEQTTFRDHVLEERLVQARRLLTEPALAAANIGEIAYRCGFGDLSYFNRSFRRRFGMTPSELRRHG